MIKFVIEKSSLVKILNKVKPFFEIEGNKTINQRLAKLSYDNDSGLIKISSLGQNAVTVSSEGDTDKKFDGGEAIFYFEEMYGWVNSQNCSHISITAKESKNKKQVNDKNASDSEKDDSSSIFICGKLNLASKDKSGTSSKWNIDLFELTENKNINFKIIENKYQSNLSFKINVKELRSSCKKVAIASSKPHNLYSNILFSNEDDNLAISCTDSIRCAVFKFKNLKFSGDKILINAISLIKILSCLDDEELSFYYFKEKNCLFVLSDKISFRLIVPPVDSVNKYPNTSMLFSFPYEKAFKANASNFKASVTPLKQVNDRCIGLKHEGSEDCICKSISEYGKSPMTTQFKVDTYGGNFSNVIAVDHLLELIKVLDGDYIDFYFNKKVFKILDHDCDNFYFFTLSISSPNYKDFINS